MISEYKPGMRHDVTVGQFIVTLDERFTQSAISHTRRVSGKIARLIRETGERDDVLIASLAKVWGVKKLFIPYCVAQTKTLLQVRR